MVLLHILDLNQLQLKTLRFLIAKPSLPDNSGQYNEYEIMPWIFFFFSLQSLSLLHLQILYFVDHVLWSIPSFLKDCLHYYWWPPLVVVQCPSFAPTPTFHNSNTYILPPIILPKDSHSNIKDLEVLHVLPILEALCNSNCLQHDIVIDLLSVFGVPIIIYFFVVNQSVTHHVQAFNHTYFRLFFVSSLGILAFISYSKWENKCLCCFEDATLPNLWKSL